MKNTGPIGRSLILAGIAACFLSLLGNTVSDAQTIPDPGKPNTDDYVQAPERDPTAGDEQAFYTGVFYYKVRVRVRYMEPHEIKGEKKEEVPRYDYDTKTGENNLVIGTKTTEYVEKQYKENVKYITELRCVTLKLPMDTVDRAQATTYDIPAFLPNPNSVLKPSTRTAPQGQEALPAPTNTPQQGEEPSQPRTSEYPVFRVPNSEGMDVERNESDRVLHAQSVSNLPDLFPSKEKLIGMKVQSAPLVPIGPHESLLSGP